MSRSVVLFAYQASFIFVTTVVGVVVACMLVIAHAGLGMDSRALRLWLAGDVSLSVYRVLTVVQPGAFGPDFVGLPILDSTRIFAATTPFVVLGVTFHALAAAHLGGRAVSPRRASLAAPLPALAYLVSTLALSAMPERMLMLLTTVACLSIVQALMMRPLMPHSRGAKVMACVSALIGLNNLLVAAAWWIKPPLLAEPVAGMPFFPPTIGMVIDFVASLFLTLSFALMIQERLREHISALSTHDPLTGALNRRGMIPLLQRELELAARHGRPFAVAMLDLDHFKLVNDAHGHAAGDAVLAGFAARAMQLKRGTDLLARWGGEEFLLVLPETSLDDATIAVERIRAGVAAAPLGERLPIVTVSAGVAALGPDIAGPEFDALLSRADERLYLAKTLRNRVVGPEVEPDAAPLDMASFPLPP